MATPVPAYGSYAALTGAGVNGTANDSACILFYGESLTPLWVQAVHAVALIILSIVANAIFDCISSTRCFKAAVAGIKRVCCCCCKQTEGEGDDVAAGGQRPSETKPLLDEGSARSLLDPTSATAGDATAKSNGQGDADSEEKKTDEVAKRAAFDFFKSAGLVEGDWRFTSLLLLKNIVQTVYIIATLSSSVGAFEGDTCKHSWCKYQQFIVRTANSGIIGSLSFIVSRRFMAYGMRAMSSASKAAEEAKRARKQSESGNEAAGDYHGVDSDTDSDSSETPKIVDFSGIDGGDASKQSCYSLSTALVYLGWGLMIPYGVTHAFPMVFAYIWLIILVSVILILAILILVCVFMCFGFCCCASSADDGAGDDVPKPLAFGLSASGFFIRATLMILVSIGGTAFADYGVMLYDGVGYSRVIRLDYNLRSTECYFEGVSRTVHKLTAFISNFF